MRRLLPAVLFLVACAGEAAVEETTSTVAVAEPTTTSTTVLSTTTTEELGSVDICRGRGEVWEPGVEYAADCLVIPLTVQVGEAGWRSLWTEPTGLLVQWVDPTDRGFVVTVGLSVSSGLGGIEAIVDTANRLAGVVVASGPRPFAVVNLSGVAFDLEGLPVEASLADRSCQDSLVRSVAFWHNDVLAYRVTAEFASRSVVFGVGACQLVKVWLTDVGDSTISVIGGTADRARHEEAVAKIESLFEGMSFEVAGS